MTTADAAVEALVTSAIRTPLSTGLAAPSPPIDAVARLWLRRSDEGAMIEQADGVWWPRSRSLVAELEPLLAQVVQHGLAARRVVYNLDAWDPAPGTVVMGGSLIRLDGYRMLSPRFVHLILTGAALPLVLLVIPPPAG